MKRKAFAALVAGLLITLVGILSVQAPAQAAPAPAASAAARQAVAIAPQLASGCGDYASGYAPIGGGWSRNYYGTCGHINRNYHPYITVSWGVAFGSGLACVKTRGYRWADGKPYWLSLGCGSGGSAKVHWGRTGTQIIARTAIKAKSLNIVTGVPVWFTD